jgi:DNA primase catalytic core
MDPLAAEAREYLQARRLSRAVCERFRLGWAPGRSGLIEAARRKGFAVDLLTTVDLAVERNGRLADRFYERVSFPICDRFGHPIAFSCRLLPAAERAAKEAGRGVGKYINSTDTPLYHKSNAVFNLHHARTACRDAKRLIVMEGPTDVMAADQAGVRECVAVLGTALTPEHARQLGSLVGDTGPLVILLDGDAAGVANSRKAVRTCLSVGVPVRVSVLPDQLDPAELLAENQTAGGDGRATFEQTVANGRHDIDHLLRAVAPRPYGLDANAQLAAVDEVLEALRPMPDAELRGLHLRACAEWFNLEPAKLERRLAGVAGPAVAQVENAAPGLPALDPAREALLHLLVRHPALRGPAFDDHGVEPGWWPEPWSTLASTLQLAPDSDLHALLACAAATVHAALRDALVRWGATPVGGSFAQGPVATGEDDQAAAQDLPRRAAAVRASQLKIELHRLSRELAEAERGRDLARARALFSDKQRLTQELKGLGT